MEEGQKKFKTANLNSLFLSSTQQATSKPQSASAAGPEKPQARPTSLSTATGHYKLSATSSRDEKNPGDKGWGAGSGSSTPQPEGLPENPTNPDAHGVGGEKKRSLDMSEEELARKGIALAPRLVEHQGTSWEDEEEEWQPLTASAKPAHSRPAVEPEVPAWGKRPETKVAETPKPLHETIRELQDSKKNGSPVTHPRPGLAGLPKHTVPPGGDALSRFRLNRPNLPPPPAPPTVSSSHSRIDRYERMDPLDATPSWRRPRDLPPPGPPAEAEQPIPQPKPVPTKTPEELKAEQAEVMRQARERAKARKEAELQEELRRQRERDEMLQRQVEEVRLQRAKEKEEASAKQRAEQERRERVREQIRREVHSAPPSNLTNELKEREEKSTIPTQPKIGSSHVNESSQAPAESVGPSSGKTAKGKPHDSSSNGLPTARVPVTRTAAPSHQSRRKPKVNLPTSGLVSFELKDDLPIVKRPPEFATAAVLKLEDSEQRYFREPLPARLPVRCVHFPNGPKRILNRRRN